MSVLQTALAGSSESDPGSSSVALFNSLFARLGDNNARVRDKAEELLLSMAGHKSFGPNVIVQQITKG